MRKLAWSLAVIASVIVSGCAQEQKSNGYDPNLKVYRHAMDQAPSSIDPVQASNVYANHVVLNAYDTLYAFKYLARPYEVKPNLAVDFPEISDDLLEYRIRIKEGVHFIDDPAFADGKGREVVAEDFVYSIKRHFDPKMRGQGAWLWQGRVVGLDEWKADGADYDQEIEGLRALDRHTILIKLIKPYPQLIFTLTMGYAALVPREAVETYGLELSSRPVGSGPFRLVSYDPSKMVFKRNEKCRQEPVDIWFEGYDPETQAFSGVESIHGRSPPFLDVLEIDFIAESAARWNSFTKGNEVQYTGVPNEQVDNILSSKHPVILKPEYAQQYHMYAGVEAGFVFQSFNMDFPEFGYNDDPERAQRNKLLRCAVIKGFDWAKRNESFYSGLGEVFPGIIPPAVPEYDPNLPRWSVERNVEEAKRLLAEGGWNEDNLPVLVYGTTSSVTARQFFEQFRGWTRKIGYPSEKVKIKQFATFGDIRRAWKNSTLPFVAKGWGLDFPDAENTLQLFYGPNGSPGSNDANYRNPEYDRLYEQTSVMLPSPERTKLYQRMNKMLIDDCVAITGLSRTRIMLWHKDVIAIPDREIVGGFFLKYVDIDKTRKADGGGA
jgi:ABC-type transport system substrate-binding protein